MNADQNILFRTGQYRFVRCESALIGVNPRRNCFYAFRQTAEDAEASEEDFVIL